MASQVLSGASNPTYTNNTGQNVRVVINFMRSLNRSYAQTPAGFSRGGVIVDLFEEVLTINWAGVSETRQNRQTANRGSTTRVEISEITPIYVGRNLSTSSGNNGTDGGLPTELMLAPNETFSAICGAYNIVIIPENG